MLHSLRWLVVIACVISLTACISWIPYKRSDIQQGNIITQAEVDQLKPGMSKTQVIAILGSPVLQNSFNENELVYVETDQINGGTITQKRLILTFKQGKLASSSGDYQLQF